MLDYFFAVGVALAGLLLVHFMFQSISRSEVVAVAAPRPQRPQPRKAASDRRHGGAVLDRKTEALIARELQRQPASMRTDSRFLQPLLLDDAPRGKNRARAAVKNVAAVEPAGEKPAAKVAGFQTVGKQPKKKRAAQQTVSRDEEMSRKLDHFFKANRKGKRAVGLRPKDEPEANTAGSGGGVVVLKKSITQTRSWTVGAAKE